MIHFLLQLLGSIRTAVSKTPVTGTEVQYAWSQKVRSQGHHTLSIRDVISLICAIYFHAVIDLAMLIYMMSSPPMFLYVYPSLTSLSWLKSWQSLFRFCAGIAFLARWTTAQQIVNGQIYTPGIAIVDAPQPNTTLGGDYLQVALDVTSDGQLQLPPYPKNNPSQIYNITLFLSSYGTGKNFTISNGTATGGSLGEIMSQEPGSTVKHVNWFWPDCLVGNGDNGADRGLYNISIRQNFRLNNTNMYTIFDLPIQVTNSIPSNSSNGTRFSCLDLNNPLWNETALNESANSFTRIVGSVIQTDGNDKGQGLGGAGILDWRTNVHSIWLVALIFFVAL